MYVNDMQTLYFSIRDLNTWNFTFCSSGGVSWNQYPWMPERLKLSNLFFPFCVVFLILPYQNTELKLN